MTDLNKVLEQNERMKAERLAKEAEDNKILDK